MASQRAGSRIARLRAAAFVPTPPWSLAVVRIGLFTTLLFEIVRYFRNGWIREYYVEPAFHFHYFGFSFVEPLPEPWTTAVFVLLGVFALCAALGVLYRLCAAGFFVGFLYVFLLEPARYLNHFYLVLLLTFLLAAMPADAALSLSSRRRGPRSLPAWCPFALRLLVALVYFYAGVAKLNADWLRGEPIRHWLADRTDRVPFGALLDSEPAAWGFAYGGLLFDLSIGPLLWWRRTRAVAFVFAVFFHTTNHLLLDIGIFPAVMLVVTTIFFSPDWPLRWFGLESQALANPPRPSSRRQSALVLGLALFFAVQVLVPLRHFLYPGSVHWTEEGHAFSWHMKLRGKSGTVRFRVVDPASGRERLVDPADELADFQVRKLAGRPDLVLEYAQHLGRRTAAEWGLEAGNFAESGVAVYAEGTVKLNDREPMPLIDPHVDLMVQVRSLRPKNWILRTLGDPVRDRDVEGEVDE